MALVKDFERKLNQLWLLRTSRIQSLLRKQKGRPRVFTKAQRDKRVRELEEMALAVLKKQVAKAELKSLTKYTKRKHLSAHGSQNRFDQMVAWADRHLAGPIVYSFWKNKTCLYVGRSESPRRLRGYRRDIFFTRADLVTVRVLSRRSDLAKAECLATHLFNPSGNGIGPAKQKYGKKCPVCSAKNEIKKDIEALFRLR